MSWEIRLHPEVESWYLGICTTDPATADLIEDAIDQLAREGPTAGRPLVDRVHGSRYHNIKELQTALDRRQRSEDALRLRPHQAGTLLRRWR